VAHDWGSGQVWDALRAEAQGDPRLRGRIASYVSVAGFSLDHLGVLLGRPTGHRRALLRQVLHSYYVFLFHQPVLPALLWRLGIGRAVERIQGLPRGHWGRGSRADAVHGLEIYRANVFPVLRAPRPFRTTVPVLAVDATGDHFLGPLAVERLDEVCTDVRVERLRAGHWAIVTHAAAVAVLVRGHVERA
jgi:hypothetical protein